jgi:MFS family permease
MPRDFRFLYVGNLVSNLGSWLLVVALPYQVFRTTGSVVATGLTLAAESVPALVVGPVAGMLVDRWDRRRVMIVNDVLRAGAVVGLLAHPPWLYLALIAENLGAVFFRPAARALLPAIVGTGPELVRANGFIALNNGIVRLVGPPLGAVLLAWLGLPVVVLLDLASYLVSAAMITMIRARHSVSAGVRVELWDGLRFTFADHVLRRMLLLNTLFFTANAVFTALLIPFMTIRFGNHPTDVGLLLSALGVGYLIGAPLAARLVNRYRAGPLLGFAQAGIGLCFLALANAPTVLVAVVAGGLIGVPGSLLLVTIETTIQRASPDELRGSVGATFFASDALAALVGGVVGSIFGTSVLTGSAIVVMLGCLISVAAALNEQAQWRNP